MFRNSLFIHLLSSKIDYTSATVEGSNIIITNELDFKNPETIALILDNKVTTLIIRGNVVNAPDFRVFSYVKHVKIEAPEFWRIPEKCFFQNSHIETVSLNYITRIIENYAFTYSSIRSINLEYVTSIGHYAFQKCPYLKEIVLKAINTIGIGPFYQSGIENLSITLSNYLLIQRGSFQNCYFLKTVTFINSLPVMSERSVSITLLDYAFMNCHQLKTVKSERLLLNIYDYAFANTGLEEFPFEQLSSVGSYAFLNTKLTTVAPTSATTSFIGSRMTFMFSYYIKTVDFSRLIGNFDRSYGIFYRCSALTTVILPSYLKILPDSMFKDCQALTTVTAPGLTDITTDGFMSCISLKTLDIGSSSLKKIGYRGIHNCPILNIPVQNCHLDERALYNNEVIESISVTYLSYWSCLNMSALKTVQINSNQNHIPVGCFMYCTKLESINLPNSVRTIYELAFAFTNFKEKFDLNRVLVVKQFAFWRSNLPGVKINYMNYEIWESFYECPKLTTIHIGPSIEYFSMLIFMKTEQKFDFIIETPKVRWDSEHKILYDQDEVLYVGPDATFPDGFFANNNFAWTSFWWYKKPFQLDGYTSKRYAISNASVTSITITDNYYSYGLYEASYCTELTSVQLAPSTTRIYHESFIGCTKLQTINLGNIVEIGTGAFTGCTSLNNIDISKVTRLGPEAFLDCTSLEKVTFPVSLEYGLHYTNHIGSRIFGNTGFTEITFSTAMLEPSHFPGMFVGCKKLKKVTLGPGVTAVLDHMFENSSVAEVEYSDSLKSIGNMSFSRTNIQTFTIKASLTDIYPTAFYGTFGINLVIASGNTKYEIIDGNHLVEKATKTLVCLFGKIPNTFKLNEQIRVLKDASLASAPKIDAVTGKVIDWGITTLIIPGNIRVEDKMQPLRYTPYLHNLCYGGIDQPPLLNSMAQRYFVTSNYSKDFWVISEEGDMDNENYIGVIRAPCSNFTPYEKFNQREFDNLYECSPKELVVEEKTPTETPLLQIDEPVSKKMSGLLVALIILAILETIFICLIAFYIYYVTKDTESSSEEETAAMKEETALYSYNPENETAVTLDNPLFNKGFHNDDPFAEDFEEKNDSKDGQFFGGMDIEEH